MVVVNPPVFDLVTGVLGRQKPMDVQALVSKGAVKRLDEGIVRGSAGTREIHRDVVLVGPPV